MRNLAARLWPLACLALAHCAPQLIIVPRGNLPSASASSPMGVSLSVHRAEWPGSPSDLADYVAPLFIEVHNGGGVPVRICYADLALTQANGERLPALNPFGPDGGEPTTLDLRQLARDGALLAGRWGGGFRGGGGGFRPRAWAPSMRTGGGFAWRPRYWPRGGLAPPLLGAGFRIAPGLRWYYGARGFYADRWLRPLWYSRWVLWWTPAIYPSSTVPVDVVAEALPEGMLMPGERISGFVYFQHANPAGQRGLELAWEMFTADGQPLGSTHVYLDIVER